MIYSEASYFDGAHFQHIADWENQKRLRRIRAQCSNIIARNTARNARKGR